MPSLLSTILAAALAVGAVSAHPATTAAPRSFNDDGKVFGPFPLKLAEQYVTVRDGVLDLTGDAAQKTEFRFTAAYSDVYDTHGSINGYMGQFDESFGFFHPVHDANQCVRGVSNTTRATHYTLEPCSNDDTEAAYGLQLFHIVSGSEFDSPPQDRNFTTDWIPFGTKGVTEPGDGNAYGGPKPLDGWRFYPRTADGVRLQSQPKGNHVGTTLRFIDESRTTN